MSPGGIEIGGNCTDWERVPMPKSATETFQDGLRGNLLASKHPDWRAGVIWSEICHLAMAILRENLEMNPTEERSTVAEQQRQSANKSQERKGRLGISRRQ